MEKFIKTSQKSSIITQAIIVIIIYLTFAVAFGSMVNDPANYAPCSQSSSSYQWGYFTYVFMVIGCILGGVVIPTLSCITLKCTEKGNTGSCSLIMFACLLNVIILGMGVVSLVCFGGLCHAYGENENCGKLHDLILAYIIIVSIGLGMGCVAGCCMACCGAVMGGKFLSMAMNNKNLEKHLENLGKMAAEQEMNPMQGGQNNEHKAVEQDSPEQKI